MHEIYLKQLVLNELHASHVDRDSEADPCEKLASPKSAAVAGTPTD